jgi:hypothetical protein
MFITNALAEAGRIGPTVSVIVARRVHALRFVFTLILFGATQALAGNLACPPLAREPKMRSPQCPPLVRSSHGSKCRWLRMTLNGLRAIEAWVVKATLLQQRFQVLAPHPEAIIEHAEVRSWRPLR